MHTSKLFHSVVIIGMALGADAAVVACSSSDTTTASSGGTSGSSGTSGSTSGGTSGSSGTSGATPPGTDSGAKDASTGDALAGWSLESSCFQLTPPSM